MSPRYKIVYEYIGKSFTGWQRLTYPIDKLPVQQVLENSLEKIYRYKIPVTGSSRTDTGVSAVGQVSHFDIHKRESKSGEQVDLLPPDELTRAMNYNFGKDYQDSLRILSTEIVPDRFHSRFNATSRTYLYKILANVSNRKDIPLELLGKVLPVGPLLNIEQMKKASDMFIGTHDFSSFRSSKCSSTRPIRSIAHIKIYDLPLPDIFTYNPKFQQYSKEQKGFQYFGIEIKARAFLHNQVRIMVSSLIKVGENLLTIEGLKEIKEKKNRKFAPETARAEPLTLLCVSYDDPKIPPLPIPSSNNNDSTTIHTS